MNIGILFCVPLGKLVLSCHLAFLLGPVWLWFLWSNLLIFLAASSPTYTELRWHVGKGEKRSNFCRYCLLFRRNSSYFMAFNNGVCRLYCTLLFWLLILWYQIFLIFLTLRYSTVPRYTNPSGRYHIIRFWFQLNPSLRLSKDKRWHTNAPPLSLVTNTSAVAAVG